MKKVLVTGADGFIGSHLVESLVESGYKVRALAIYNSQNYWGWLEELNCLDSIEVVTGDIRDHNLCKEITKDIDIVFHLAALIGIPYSYVAPQSYVDTNIVGTMNMILAAKENNIQKFIHTSTSEVYGTAQYTPIDEKHPRQPQSPYSASKISADAMAMSYFNSFNFPVTIARPFNTYGPRQSARAIIPTIISQIAAGEKELKLGDLSPTRDFNYVKDTCEGFIKIAESEKTIGEDINICSNFEISMQDTVDYIIKSMGRNIQVVTDESRERPKNSEVFRLWGDNSKIKKLTGFTPKYDIHKGLNETIEWFSNVDNLSRYKTNRYNI